MVDWIQQHSWGLHHVEWHTSRQWDTLTAAQQQWALQQGWQRAPRQEGGAGNGFDFLLMHRAMLQVLREQFPEQAALLAGWQTVPTDPDDATDPVPAGNPRDLDPNMLQAITRLQNQADSFDSDDACGLYIQTQRRPVPGDPFATSTDPTTGLHNYLHNRFSDSNSPINMGDPLVNLSNSQFWRLHGWIDARWSAFRRAKGLSDDDPAFVQQLNDEKQHLMGPMPPMHLTARAIAAAHAAVPMALRRPFQDTLAKRFLRAVTTIPRIYTIDDLAEYLQIAISLEHYTLPPYLCALWSIKPAASNGQVRGILLGVAKQEMLHMALVCNLMKAIGRQPEINTADAVPVYPNHLPGVNLADPIDLAPLSRARVELFLKIEMPEHGPLPDVGLVAAGGPPLAATIGDFYDIIDDGLARLSITYQTAGQLETSIGSDELFRIDSQATARRAIQLIKEQGEGTSTSQGAVDFGGGLAHYYKFRQLLLEKLYVRQPDGTWKIDASSSLPFPADADIWPMDPVPAGGYPGIAEAQSFDQAYSTMLGQLQNAWIGQGSADALDDAVGNMFQLQGLAVALMQKKRPDGPGNYGPDFRRIAGVGPSALAAAGPTMFTAASSSRFQRVYLTLLSAGAIDHTVYYAVFPASDYGEPRWPAPETFESRLAEVTDTTPISSFQIPQAILTLLLAQEANADIADCWTAVRKTMEGAEVDAELAEAVRELSGLAEQAAFAPVVAFESSPLAAASLASIAIKAAHAGPIAIGSVVGFLAAGPTPFLLVTVPAGIVLCGASTAFAKWIIEHRDDVLGSIVGIGKRRDGHHSPPPAKPIDTRAQQAAAPQPDQPTKPAGRRPVRRPPALGE
jgi:hypothetical protein